MPKPTGRDQDRATEVGRRNNNPAADGCPNEQNPREADLDPQTPARAPLPAVKIEGRTLEMPPQCSHAPQATSKAPRSSPSTRPSPVMSAGLPAG